MGDVAPVDREHLALVRGRVKAFLERCGREHDHPGALVLDVAPQEHEGAAPSFPQATVETLDVDPSSGPTYVADLCVDNSEAIAGERFDHVVCTEVLEHTLQPFAAVAEIRRLLKPGGLVFLSVPFDLRIHGPLPDCWRFTEHGLRALLADFEILELDALENPDRFLMPVHYTVVARKP